MELQKTKHNITVDFAQESGRRLGKVVNGACYFISKKFCWLED